MVNGGRNEFDWQYQTVLRQIMESGVEEVNKRTGHKTRILPGAFFAIERGFPLLSLRKIPVRIFVAEMIWYIMGSRMPSEFLQEFTKIWDDFSWLSLAETFWPGPARGFTKTLKKGPDFAAWGSGDLGSSRRRVGQLFDSQKENEYSLPVYFYGECHQ